MEATCKATSIFHASTKLLGNLILQFFRKLHLVNLLKNRVNLEIEKTRLHFHVVVECFSLPLLFFG